MNAIPKKKSCLYAAALRLVMPLGFSKSCLEHWRTAHRIEDWTKARMISDVQTLEFPPNISPRARRRGAQGARTCLHEEQEPTSRHRKPMTCYITDYRIDKSASRIWRCHTRPILYPGRRSQDFSRQRSGLGNSRRISWTAHFLRSIAGGLAQIWRPPRLPTNGRCGSGGWCAASCLCCCLRLRRYFTTFSV